MSGVSVISVAMATTWSPSNGESPPAPPNIGRVGSRLLIRQMMAGGETTTLAVCSRRGQEGSSVGGDPTGLPPLCHAY